MDIFEARGRLIRHAEALSEKAEVLADAGDFSSAGHLELIVEAIDRVLQESWKKTDAE